MVGSMVLCMSYDAATKRRESIRFLRSNCVVGFGPWTAPPERMGGCFRGAGLLTERYPCAARHVFVYWPPLQGPSKRCASAALIGFSLISGRFAMASPAVSNELNVYESAEARFQTAARKLGLEEGLLRR